MNNQQELKGMYELINNYTLNLHGNLNDQFNKSEELIVQKTYFQSFWLILFAQITQLILVILYNYGMVSFGLLVSCILISLIGFLINKKYHRIIPQFMLFQKILYALFTYYTIQYNKGHIYQVLDYSDTKLVYDAKDIKCVVHLDDSLISFCTILTLLSLMKFIKMQTNFIMIVLGYTFTLVILIICIPKNIYQVLVLVTTSIIVFFFIYTQEKNKRIQFLESYKQSQDLLGWKKLLDAQIPTSIFVVSTAPDVESQYFDCKKTEACSVQQQPFSIKNCKIQFANKVCLKEFNTSEKEDLIHILERVTIKNRYFLDSQQNGFDLGTGNTLLSNNNYQSKEHSDNLKFHNTLLQNYIKNQKKEEESNNIEFFQMNSGSNKLPENIITNIQQNVLVKNYIESINSKSPNKLINLEKEDLASFSNQNQLLSNNNHGKLQQKILSQNIQQKDKSNFSKLNDSMKYTSYPGLRSRNGTLSGLVSDQNKFQNQMNVFSLKDAILSIFQNKENQLKQQSDFQINFENQRNKLTSKYKIQIEQLANENNQKNIKTTKITKLNKQKNDQLDKLVEQYQQLISFEAKEIIHFQNCKYQKEQIDFLDKNKINKPENLKYYDIKLLDCQWDHQDSVMVVINDISPQIIYQRQQEVNEYKEKIISSVTHNLKTPLNGIFTFLQTALMQAQDSDLKNLIKLSFSLGKQQMLMINDIIDYSQLIKGELNLDVKQDKIQNIVNEVLEIFQNQIEMKRNIKFNFINQVKENEIGNTDIQRLQQVLVNILQNAIKFTFEGEIIFKIKKTDINILTFQVTDTGCGIEKDVLTQINNMQSLEASDYQHGMGLGLAISKMILSYLGPDNSFELESIVGMGTKVKFNIYQNINQPLTSNKFDMQPIKDEESGNTFSNKQIQGQNLEQTVSLVREPSDISEKCKVSIPKTNGTNVRNQNKDVQKNNTLESFLENKNIIIVDDTPFNIKVLKCIFKDIPNLTIQEAFNGQECIDILLNNKDTQYDLIFMDVNMPVLDGLSATQNINELIAQNEILYVPVIMVTAYEMPLDKELQVGAKAHIPKPVQKRNLIEALKKVFPEEEEEELEEQVN